MRYLTSLVSGWIVPAVLAISLILPACQTLTTEQRAQLTDQAIAAKVCEVWKPQSYDSVNDTKLTTDEAKMKNKVRAAFCKGTEK